MRFVTRIQTAIQRLNRPLADALFAVLLLALVVTSGWLVARHDRYWDWTASASNRLSAESVAIVQRLDGPLRATVFAAPDSPIAQAIGRLLARYVPHLPTLEIDYLDPQLFPERARDAKVSLTGQILLNYRGRRETLNEISERAIGAALIQLSETRTPWIAAIEGHGERAIAGPDGADLGRFGDELTAQGFLVRPLDLATLPDVPDNTRLLILSLPTIPLFPGEVDALVRYLDRGGNLLWLLDPGPLNGLEPLLDALGVRILPGVVVDAAAAKLKIENPGVAVIADYPDDSLAAGLTAPALLPGSLAFAPEVAPGWMLASYLATGSESWNETGRLTGPIHRDDVVGEVAGPLPVLLALTRTLPADALETAGASEREQRVLVSGDGDFLSNAQLGAHGNRALGMALMRWLSGSESLLELPPLPTAAAPLVLDDQRRMLIGLGALVLLPGLFLSSGLLIRWLRWRGQ